MALPTALFAMIASMALASAAILSSVDVQQGTTRDHDSKEAIAAADAGASVALLRLNRFQGSLSATYPCVGPAGEAQAASAGWCPETASESVGGASFTYRVSAYDGTGIYSVVATGTSDTVSRRVEVGLVSYSGKNVFANEKLIGRDNFMLEGTPDIRTDIGTNGDIEGKGTPTICGNVRHGIGKEAPEPDCEGEVKEGEMELPPFTAPENLATINSNCRLEVSPPESCKGVDTYTKKRTATDPWDAETRAIHLSKNAKLTVGGDDYFACSLTIDSGELIMAAESNVRIFIDTPENCGLSPGAVQVKLTGNARIVSTAYNPAQGTYDVPGIYVLGESSVELAGSFGTNEFMLYAPDSHIDIGGSATWKGMFAGKSIKVHGTPLIESDPNIPPPDIHFATLLQRTRYVECTGVAVSPPDASC